MHFLKRAALFSVFLMLVLSLSACSSRTAVTEDAFTAAMDKLGFTDQTPEDGSASSAGVVTMRLYSSPTDGGAVYYVYEDSVTAHQRLGNIIILKSPFQITSALPCRRRKEDVCLIPAICALLCRLRRAFATCAARLMTALYAAQSFKFLLLT